MKIIIENRTQLHDRDAMELAMQMMESDRRGGISRKFDRGVTVHASSNALADTFVVVYSEGK